MSRVLVVEDEVHLAQGLRFNLEAEGYAAEVVGDGEAATDRLLEKKESFDAVVLDIMLPGKDGFRVVSELRAARNYVPVLMLTARGRPEDVLKGFASGADDYLAKPFDLGEFLARSKALVRRGKGQRSPLIAIGDLELDTVGRTVRRGQKEIALAPMEYRVLEYLSHRPKAVVSKAELLEHLYDYNWEKFSNVIEVYVSGLRRKIDDNHAVKLIHTVRGHGYVLRPGR
jgi:DNA-binding response OmpR family regulator